MFFQLSQKLLLLCTLLLALNLDDEFPDHARIFTQQEIHIISNILAQYIQAHEKLISGI